MRGQAAAILEKAFELPAGQCSSVGSLLDGGTDTFLCLVKGGRGAWMKPARAAHKVLESLANLELALVTFEQGQKLEAVHSPQKAAAQPRGNSAPKPPPPGPTPADTVSPVDAFGQLPVVTLAPAPKTKPRATRPRDDGAADLQLRLSKVSLPWENLSPQAAWDMTFGEAWNSPPVLYLRLICFLTMRLFLVTIPKALMIVVMSCGLVTFGSMLLAPHLFARGLIGVLRLIPNALFSCAEELAKEVGFGLFLPFAHCPAHCGPGAFNFQNAERVAAYGPAPASAPAPAVLPAIQPQTPSTWVPFYATLLTILVWRQGPLSR